ncbi:hypothetical protein AI27_20360 [Sphingomonas sp. BHC-A]|nr:hypothetical protein AI27_20360 [Sphingomonas sp. BHC-A]
MPPVAKTKGMPLCANMSATGQLFSPCRLQSSSAASNPPSRALAQASSTDSAMACSRYPSVSR